MIILDLLCYLAAAIAIIIGVMKNSQMLRNKEGVDTLLEEYNIKRAFRLFFIPTFYGWLFIECVVLAMVLFVIKDTVSKTELVSWQDKIMSLATSGRSTDAKTADTLYIKSDTGSNIAGRAADSVKKADTIVLRQLVLRTPKDSMTAEQKQGAFITLYGNDITDTARSDDLKLTLILMNDGLGTAQNVQVTVLGVYEFDRHSYVDMKLGKAAKAVVQPADTTLAYCHFSKRKMKLEHLSLYCKIAYTTNGRDVQRAVLLSYNKELKWEYKGEPGFVLGHLKANGML